VRFENRHLLFCQWVYLQEVLVVRLVITQIPNMPGCVLGLLNQRNRVLWVIDYTEY